MFKKIVIISFFYSLFFTNFLYANSIENEMSNLNSLMDVSKCIKKHIKNMNKTEAKNYCVSKNLKDLNKNSDLSHSVSGWASWNSLNNEIHDKFKIGLNVLNPNIIVGAVKVNIGLKNTEDLEIEINNLFSHSFHGKDHVTDRTVDISQYNISSGDITYWSISNLKVLKIAEYKKIFSGSKLSDVNKCIKQLNKPKEYFEDTSLFGYVSLREGCIYELSQDIKDVDSKVSYKIKRRDNEMALTIENNVNNNFIITAGNLYMNFKKSKCDLEQYKKDDLKNNPGNPFAGLGSPLIEIPEVLMNKFGNDPYNIYLMPGEQFSTKYIDISKDRRFKYCTDFTPKLGLARILNIE